MMEQRSSKEKLLSSLKIVSICAKLILYVRGMRNIDYTLDTDKN